MNFYDQEIHKLLEKRAFIENDIKNLEEQFFIKQGELEREQSYLNQHMKHHESKEEHKDLAMHEKLIKNIKKDLSGVERKMDALHLSIVPIEKETNKLKEKQKGVEANLETLKHQEASLFYKYLNQNQSIYQLFIEEINQFFGSIDLFYQALLNEVYVSDAFLSIQLKTLDKLYLSFEKQLFSTHQKLLNLMLNYYHQNEKEQLKMIKGFKKSLASLIRSLKKNYANQVTSCSVEQTKKLIDKDNQLKLEKQKLKKKQDISKKNHAKKQLIDQLTLKSIENKITENSMKQLQELKLLNDNQLSIAAQYNSEYEDKKKLLEESYQKRMATTENSILTQDKNIQALDQSITAKNQLILSRYQITHEKNIESLKQKTYHYEQLVLKATALDIERNKQAQITLKRQANRREAEMRNINNHHKRYLMTTKWAQNRVLARENRSLKKSHNFKMRMLHLN